LGSVEASTSNVRGSKFEGAMAQGLCGGYISNTFISLKGYLKKHEQHLLLPPAMQQTSERILLNIAEPHIIPLTKK